jgi:hypothetical protein
MMPKKEDDELHGSNAPILFADSATAQQGRARLASF